MNIFTDPSIGVVPDPAAEFGPAPAGELGREDFLSLLIAQLENQDPLNPTSDREFVAQLATFSSLEQQIATNANLESLAHGQSTLINAQALSLIGKEALIESGDGIRIRGGVPDTVVYALPKAAESATLTVYGPDGAPVRVFELERTPGRRYTLEWDGTDSSGRPLADGDYRFEIDAREPNGDAMSVARFRSIPIDGVNFGNQGIALVSGDEEIPFELILEIRAGRS